MLLTHHNQPSAATPSLHKALAALQPKLFISQNHLCASLAAETTFLPAPAFSFRPSFHFLTGRLASP
ncbi:hypothetical protein EVG20_g1654 [Dentipellis fragilis]|uniref:Uncharacterized protein n=1 Tax=Dentipellis fragilis TaxID=205917 RepID=A0A4Y9ZC14_9AGAM|nr:hypothetical protein EVG20_g1654 [Dentipellis fragilis]